MNTKIWLEELSFGSNFRNLRAFGPNRVWCYFLVHTFKIKKFELISYNGSRDIAKSLKISFGSSFVNLRALGSKFSQFRFPVYTFQTKKRHSIISTRSFFSTRHFLRKYNFFSWSRIYIPVYTYLDYFSNFTPILTKVSKPFFSQWKWVWKYINYRVF